MCHSDSFAVTGGFGNTYPLVPGHEVIGKVSPKNPKTTGEDLHAVVAMKMKKKQASPRNIAVHQNSKYTHY